MTQTTTSLERFNAEIRKIEDQISAQGNISREAYKKFCEEENKLDALVDKKRDIIEKWRKIIGEK